PAPRSPVRRARPPARQPQSPRARTRGPRPNARSGTAAAATGASQGPARADMLDRGVDVQVGVADHPGPHARAAPTRGLQGFDEARVRSAGHDHRLVAGGHGIVARLAGVAGEPLEDVPQATRLDRLASLEPGRPQGDAAPLADAVPGL